MNSQEERMPNPILLFPWIHGALDCASTADPPLQIFRFDENTFILRQSKCLNFEAPFLYLLIGSQMALLLDTGAKTPADKPCPVSSTVRSILQKWQDDHNVPILQLIVAHSHSHEDHFAGDSQFVGQANTHLIRPLLNDVKEFFGLQDWPNGMAELNIGNRSLTIFPLPGHEKTHIAIYDSNSQLLLTGDTLYPGLLTVQDWSAYRRSSTRLAQFAATHPVSFVLGAHIEMTKKPRQMYPLGTTFQPNEHALPLMAEDINTWHNACEAMGDPPHRLYSDNFIIEPY